MRNVLAFYPPARPLILVAKQLVFNAGLSNPYEGGLSSYGLTLMVLSFLQSLRHSRRPPLERSLGRLLMDFLSFFGAQFSPQSQLLQPTFFFEQDHNPVQFKSGAQLAGTALCIVDPLNSLNNVARSSFRFHLVQNLFVLALEELTDFCSFELERAHEQLLRDPEAAVRPCEATKNCRVLQRLFSLDAAVLLAQN